MWGLTPGFTEAFSLTLTLTKYEAKIERARRSFWTGESNARRNETYPELDNKMGLLLL